MTSGNQYGALAVRIDRLGTGGSEDEEVLGEQVAMLP